MVVDLRDAVSYHQLVLASEGRSEATQRQYLYFQRVFLRYLEHRAIEPTLDALNAANVRQALLWYQGQADQRRSRGGQVAAATFVDLMHLFARFLEREEIVDIDPLRSVRRVKVAKRLREPYTQSEIIALWGACRQSHMPNRDEALFLLLLDTGMRIGEACTITLEKLRLEQRQIVIGEHGKGRRERLVPVGISDKRDGGRTVRALRRYLAERPDNPRGGQRLFLGRDSYPLEAVGGSHAIQRLGEIAHVANTVAHRLRNTFCTQYLVMYPGDELGLRRIVGHVSKEVLATYVSFAQSVITDRAGHASLAERWLDPHYEPPLVPYRGGGNVSHWHCADCQRKAVHSTSKGN
jgi:site-specific recombinase XerD